MRLKLSKYFILFWIFFTIYFLSLYYVHYPSLKYKIFNSPDETAIQFFLDKTTLRVSSLNIPSAHPRSILVWGNVMVPITFPFFILVLLFFYLLAFKNLYILYLFWYLALLFLFYLLFDIFQNKEKFLFISVFVLTFPVIYFYIFQIYFPQILQVYIFLMSLLFLYKKREKWAFFMLFVAISIRPIESWCLLALYLFYDFFYLKNVFNKQRLLKYFFVLLFSILIFLILNYLVYNNLFLFGYILPASTSLLSEQNLISFTWKDYVKRIIIHFYNFFIQYSFVYSFLTIISFSYFVYKYRKYRFKIVLFLLILASLFLFYAVQNLDDHVIKNYVSLASAYFRYYFIIYIFIAVLIANWFYLLLKKNLIRYSVLLLFILFNFYLVFVNGVDALLKKKATIENYHVLQNIVKNDLQEKFQNRNIVVLTDRLDKVFFPNYPVMHVREFKNLEVLHDLQVLLQDKTSYTIIYLGFPFNEKDLNYLNNQKFVKYNYYLEFIKNYPEYNLALYVLKVK